jgi:hypothetical protein
MWLCALLFQAGHAIRRCYLRRKKERQSSAYHQRGQQRERTTVTSSRPHQPYVRSLATITSCSQYVCARVSPVCPADLTKAASRNPKIRYIWPPQAKSVRRDDLIRSVRVRGREQQPISPVVPCKMELERILIRACEWMGSRVMTLDANARQCAAGSARTLRIITRFRTKTLEQRVHVAHSICNAHAEQQVHSREFSSLFGAHGTTVFVQGYIYAT